MRVTKNKKKVFWLCTDKANTEHIPIYIYVYEDTLLCDTVIHHWEYQESYKFLEVSWHHQHARSRYISRRQYIWVIWATGQKKRFRACSCCKNVDLLYSGVSTRFLRLLMHAFEVIQYLTGSKCVPNLTLKGSRSQWKCYLSSVLVLTVRDLQDSVHFYVIWIKRILLHLKHTHTDYYRMPETLKHQRSSWPCLQGICTFL